MADVTNTYYPATGARIGYGAEVLVGDGASPENFTAVANVREISLGQTTSETVDRTHLRSPNRHREKMVGLADTSDTSFMGLYDPNHESLSTAGGGTGAFQGGGLPSMREDGIERTFIFRTPIEVAGGGSPTAYHQVVTRGFVSGFSPFETLSTEAEIQYSCTITHAQAPVLP